MKSTTILIALFGLMACNNQADKTVVDEKPQTVRLDSFYFDSTETGGTGGQPYREWHACDFDSIIADEKTPALAKDIYLDKDWDLNNNEALALLDSLKAKNKSSRPFYCQVVTRSYKKSDGFFSEGLGHAGKKYVEENTQEFISNFDKPDCFTESDLSTWADIVILEFSIINEGGRNKTLVRDYIRKLQSNCRDCSPTQKVNIRKFGEMLQQQWQVYLSNVDK